MSNWSKIATLLAMELINQQAQQPSEARIINLSTDGPCCGASDQETIADLRTNALLNSSAE